MAEEIERVDFEFNVTFRGTAGFDDADEYMQELRRIDVACKAMGKMKGESMGGDVSLLADYADSLESLVNLMRRMRAFKRVQD